MFFESKAGKIQIIEDGTAVDYSEEEATRILSESEVTAIADVKMGDKSATAWGCDLTHGYIEIKLEDNRLIYVPAIKDSNIEVDLSAGCIKLHVLPGLVD